MIGFVAYMITSTMDRSKIAAEARSAKAAGDAYAHCNDRRRDLYIDYDYNWKFKLGTSELLYHQHKMTQAQYNTVRSQAYATILPLLKKLRGMEC